MSTTFCLPLLTISNFLILLLYLNIEKVQINKHISEIYLYLILLTGNIITRELRALLDKQINNKKKSHATLEYKLYHRRQEEAVLDSCGITTLKYICIM